jgi:P2 family phage contractile tail tube protein
MIQLPKVLKNMNLFVDGRGFAGRVDEIQLPKLALKTEEHRAGGMDAPIEIDLGMDKLEAELTLSDYDPQVFKLFGLLDVQATPITLRGAIQAQGEAAKPVVVNLRGGLKAIEPPTTSLRSTARSSSRSTRSTSCARWAASIRWRASGRPLESKRWSASP